MPLGHPCVLLMLAMLIGGTGDALAMSNTGSGSPQCSSNEKKVCTLGPPPVCQCVPEGATNIKARGTMSPSNASGARQRQ